MIKMNFTKAISYSLIFLLLFSSCSDKSEHNSKDETIVFEGKIYESSQFEPTQTNNNDDTDLKDYLEKSTWGETIKPPRESTFRNFPYSQNMLFQSWFLEEDLRNEAIFIFSKDSVKISGETSYLYTINHDSLRIFTKYEQLGDGYIRGIITNLDSNNLEILFSDGESMNFTCNKN